MPKSILAIVVFGIAVTFLAQSAAQAGDESDYKKAYDSAVTLQKEARSYHNGWTVTTTALTSAKQAADTHDFANAAKLAKNAETLAETSVEQAKRQKGIWIDAIVR